MRYRLAGVALLAAFFGSSSNPTHAADPALAKQGYEILKTYCNKCHGTREEAPGFRVLDREILVKKTDGLQKPYVVPGQPKDSFIWERAVDGEPDMPPSYEKQQPTADERKTLEQWIAGGAEFPTETSRPFLDDKFVLTTIRDHLNTVRRADRPYQRYIVLANLHNNRKVTDDQIRIHRAAVSKLINSLSWQQEIILPKAIDKGTEVILNIDLKALGWEPSLWKSIARAYPYAVHHVEDVAIGEIEDEIDGATHDKFAVIRGDWFVATVSKAPLYDAFLNLPETLGELEVDRLDVSLDKNFHRDILKRAGLITSGVSRHNRLVERHPARFGAYWRSYDFGSSAGKGNLLSFPLGPKFHGNRFDDQAFEQAGGEVIFNLPNGLQGYMLADAKDRRLKAPAPVSIVRDLEETAGSPEVVNGLSCIACHHDGMRRFSDSLRDNPAVFGDAKAKVLQLYPLIADMDKLLDQDSKKFLDAVDKAIGPFLNIGNDKKSAKDLPEPVSEAARLYFKDLTAEAIAADMGLADVAELQAAIKNNPRLKELGLGPLLNANAVKRELWESPGLSLFHQTAIQFGKGPRTEL